MPYRCKKVAKIKKSESYYKNRESRREAAFNYREENKEQIKQKRKKIGRGRASDAVYYAIKKGNLPNLKKERVICSKCSKERATCYDHRDYNKPLEVTPVCVSCNKILGPAIHFVPKKHYCSQCDIEITPRNKRGLCRTHCDEYYRKVILPITKKRRENEQNDTEGKD